MNQPHETKPPTLKPQEIPYDSPESCMMFRSSPNKAFLATSRAIEAYSNETIQACLWLLQDEAAKHGGLERLQIFEAKDDRENLLFLNGPDGAINAMLSSDY